MFSTVMKFSAFLLIFTSSSAFATVQISLSEIKTYESAIFAQLMNPHISKSAKLAAIRDSKNSLEERLRDLIASGTANPADLSNPQSDLAKTFEFVDQLTILSQMEMDGSKISEKACREAQAMISVTLIDPNQEEPRRATDLENKTLQILQGLCR